VALTVLDRTVLSLALAIALTMSACSGQTAQQESDGAGAVETGAQPGPAIPEPVAEQVPPGFIITSQSRMDLENYSSFQYATATTQGLSPEATIVADALIASMVDSVVNGAVAEGAEGCLPNDLRCKSFELTLTPRPCVEGYLCLLQESELATNGSGRVAFRSLVLNIDSGQGVPLKDFVEPGAALYLQGYLNDEFWGYLESKGVEYPTYIPILSPQDVRAWLPTSTGFDIWFEEGEVAAASMGPILISVPYPDTTQRRLVTLTVEQAEPILTDLDLGSYQPLECFEIEVAASDPTWGWLSSSRFAGFQSDGRDWAAAVPEGECQPFDGISLIGFQGGSWRQLDVGGSAFECELRSDLIGAGVPVGRVLDDLDVETDCEEFR
jgi:hypothetical protein